MTPEDADRIGFTLAEILVQLRRIADALEQHSQPPQASRPAADARRPRADHRRKRGDEQRKRGGPSPRFCADCGTEFVPARGFERRCEPCFRGTAAAPAMDRSLEPGAETMPAPYGPI